MKRNKIWSGVLLSMLILCLCTVVMPAASAYGEDSSKTFSYDLSINGEHEIQAKKGDILTVSVYLQRTDSEEAYDMYSMQDEIRYSDAFMKIVDGSLVLGNEIVNTDIQLIDGDRSFYLNYLSLGNGKQWEAKKLLASFQVEILADSGEYTLHSENGLVAVSDGSDSYKVSNQDVKIVLPSGGTKDSDGTKVKDTSDQQGNQEHGAINPLYLIIAGLVAVILVMGILLVKKTGKGKIHEK